ncbi:MAG: glycosyltransferase [Gemmatimonadales bacterium]|nr:glycosyltransferase [Gemmatimonadales bacterium]
MSEQQPSLLFLSHRLPYPAHNGAALRTLNTLKQLRKGFRVTMLCFDRRDAPTGGLTPEARLEAIAELADVAVVPIPQERSGTRLLWDHLRSVAAGKPYTWYVHDSAAFGGHLRRVLDRGAFGLVHVDTLDLVRWLPELRGIPAACTHHNVESALLRQRAEHERGWRGAYMAWQAERLLEAEREWMPRLALNVACSDDDAAAFRRIAPGSRVEVVPNGVDVEYFRPAPLEAPRGGLVCVGGTSWHPNRDGLEWCAGELLPKIRSRAPEASLTWIGKISEAERTRYASTPGLRLTGYVPDVRPYVQQAACFIAPLRVGGGTRLKILDAWAMGAPVVSTRIGAEGLAAVHEENALLADDAESFADSVAKVLADPTLQLRLGAAGRRTAETIYDWDVLGVKMRALYESALRATD